MTVTPSTHPLYWKRLSAPPKAERRIINMKQYDYLVVGAGLFGAVFARQAADAGKKVLVIDKRDHIAGNVYTEQVEGIHC